MSSRQLPARPHLEHLKHEAKALHRALRERDPSALSRARDAIGVEQPEKLVDAQRIIAREYGFASWARLRSHVLLVRGPDEAIAAFLDAVQNDDAPAARRVLRAFSTLGRESIHVAAALGLHDECARLLGANRDAVRALAGDPPAEPLSYLTFSPFHGESVERDAALLATARLLLQSGADANARFSKHHLPALYAVTGLRSVPALARLLLDAGANPTDGESVYHAAEHFRLDALELLWSRGVNLDDNGDSGNTPLYFLLRYWMVEPDTNLDRGVRWLLDHGANPNVVCGRERETALHVAVRRGQRAELVELLLTHGADVRATRADGASAWQLATRAGFDHLAALLERAGAPVETLSATELLLSACGRGDVDAARRLSTPELLASLSAADQRLLIDAATAKRDDAVAAYLAAGFPVSVTDDSGATALHFAALNGRAAQVRALLAAGADFRLRDTEYSATPLSWVAFGADHIAARDGDYAGAAVALLEAGARLDEHEHRPRHPGVRVALRRFGNG